MKLITYQYTRPGVSVYVKNASIQKRKVGDWISHLKHLESIWYVGRRMVCDPVLVSFRTESNRCKYFGSVKKAFPVISFPCVYISIYKTW